MKYAVIACFFVVILGAARAAQAAPCAYLDSSGNIYYTDVYTAEEWRRLGCGGYSDYDPEAIREWRERCCKGRNSKVCKIRKECKPKPAKKAKNKKKQKKKRR